MAINIAKIGTIVEKYMVDTVEIFTKARGTMNLTTGLYTETETVVYSGKALLAPNNTPNKASEEAGIAYSDGSQILIPRNTEGVELEMYVRVLTANDLYAVGEEYCIKGLNRTTYNAYLGLALERYQPVS